MAEIPNINVPKIDQIRKYPWASMTYFLLGVCGVLLYIIITQKPSAECDIRYDKLNQQFIATLKDNAVYFRDKQEDKGALRSKDDTIALLKQKIVENSKLTKQVLVKSK